MRNHIILIGIFAFTVGSSQSYAEGNGVILQGCFGRNTQILDFVGAPTVEYTASHFDLKLTYTWSSGIYAGGLYSALQNLSAVGNDNRQGLAVVLGYQINEFYIDGAYFLASQLERANGFTYSSGSAFAFSLGANFHVSSNYIMGLGLVYKSFQWSESKLASASALVHNNMTDIYPGINIGYSF